MGIAANVFIFFGIWGELRFAKRARNADDSRVAEAEKATEEARERAAQAELETQLLKRQFAWRHFTHEQRRELIAALRGKASSLDVLVEFQRNDAEAFLYGFELIQIFKSAGVEKRRFVPNEYLSGMVFGLWITEAVELGTFISDAFRETGISSSVAYDKDLSTHLPRNEVAPNLYIFIGPKPPVPAETEVEA